MDQKERAVEEAILSVIFEAQVIGDPSRFTSADELKYFVFPALERAAENAEERRNNFEKHLRELLAHVTNEHKQVRLSVLVPVFSMVGNANLDGRYDGLQAGYALHRYGKWLDSKEWLKKVMRVMRDYPGISPERMCRELDRRYKQTVSRTGKHREDKATPEGWSNLTWINELLMNRTNVDVLRSKAKKQLESNNFKLLCAWYKLDGKDPLSKREPDDEKEFD